MSLFISDFPYMTVGATAEEFFGFVELKHVGFDVFGHEKKESEFKIEIEGNKINSKLGLLTFCFLDFCVIILGCIEIFNLSSKNDLLGHSIDDMSDLKQLTFKLILWKC